MGRAIRNLGWRESVNSIPLVRSGKQAVFQTTDDKRLFVIIDSNLSGATGEDDSSDVTKIHLYQQDADGGTVSLRASVNCVGNGPMPVRMWSAEIMPNNSIAVVYQANNADLRYCQITYSTWAVQSHTALPIPVATNYNLQDIDVTVSDAGTPMVATMFRKIDATNHPYIATYIRRTSDNTWVTGLGMTEVKNARAPFESADISICALKGGPLASSRVALAYSLLNGDEDSGVRLASFFITESTGGIGAAGLERLTTVAFNEVAQDFHYDHLPRKSFLAASGDLEFTYGIITLKGSRGPKIHSGRWSRVTGDWVNTHRDEVQSLANVNQIQIDRGCAMTYGADTLNFYVIPKGSFGIENSYFPLNYVHVFNRTNNSTTTYGAFAWDDTQSASQKAYFPMGGGSRNNERAEHGMVYARRLSADNWNLRHHRAGISRAPAAPVVPRQGAVVTTNLPALQAEADLDLDRSQSHVRIRWQIASDRNFTTNVRQYAPGRENPLARIITGTNRRGTTVNYRAELPIEDALATGTWFVRACHLDVWGNESPYTEPNQFSVLHPPAPARLSPATGAVIVYGTGEVQFDWRFSDPSPDDTQRAMQLVIQTTSNNVTIYDSSKVVQDETAHSVELPTTVRNQELRWRMRLWDRDDTMGAWSAWQTFLVAQSPIISITTPTPSQIVATALPAVTFDIDTGAIKSLDSWRVMFKQGATLLYSSNWIRHNGAENQFFTKSHTPPRAVLKNRQSYTVHVDARDTLGLEGGRNVQISTSWTPPATPRNIVIGAGDYNRENRGYVSIRWSDFGREAATVGWRIYRQADLLDADGVTILQDQPWRLIHTEYSALPEGYYFEDYYAPAGYRIKYQITQFATRFGEEVESEAVESITVDLMSDGYWLIDPAETDPNNKAFKIATVTGDSYTEEFEEQEYTVINRGRKVDRGSRIGIKGQLDAQLRDSPGRSARQKKIRLERLKEENRRMFLRTPFGDSYWVAIGNISVTRIPGVGRSEFVDISLPYSEVAD